MYYMGKCVQSLLLWLVGGWSVSQHDKYLVKFPRFFKSCSIIELILIFDNMIQRFDRREKGWLPITWKYVADSTSDIVDK